MKRQPASITLEQRPLNPEAGNRNSEYVYDVVATRNTLVRHIGDALAPGDVQELIDAGIGVTIRRRK